MKVIRIILKSEELVTKNREIFVNNTMKNRSIIKRLQKTKNLTYSIIDKYLQGKITTVPITNEYIMFKREETK